MQGAARWVPQATGGSNVLFKMQCIACCADHGFIGSAFPRSLLITNRRNFQRMYLPPILQNHHSMPLVLQVLLHPVWGSSVYPASMFTCAPLEALQAAIAAAASS